MSERIIALVDGSTYSEAVCRYAAWLAERTGLEVELMHVLGRRETGGSGGDLSGAIALGARSSLLKELSSLDEQRAKLVVHRGRAILEDAKAMLEGTGVTAKEHLRHGDLIEAIGEREPESEMIVIGKRGAAADFAKEHLGSNLERVMRAVTTPLFVASRSFQPITKVLVAYDGSASAMRAVDYLSRSPLYADLTIRIATVGSPSEKLRSDLEGAKAMLAAAGFEADTAILPGQPEQALGQFVEEEGFDHVVMGASGHSRLRSLFVGSTSLEMIRTCKVPILLVR